MKRYLLNIAVSFISVGVIGVIMLIIPLFILWGGEAWDYFLETDWLLALRIYITLSIVFGSFMFCADEENQ